jgi:hypothetical protein
MVAATGFVPPPTSAREDVTVEPVAAIGTWPAVIPDKLPLPLLHPEVVKAPPAPFGQTGEVEALIAVSTRLETEIAGLPESPPAVPVVFWLKVGKLVRLAALTAGNAALPFSCTKLFAAVPTV